MEFKGTKGHWSYKAGNVNQLTVVKIGDAHEFELEINGKNRIEEEIANAQLISCAPEMLDMLNKFIEAVEDEKIIIKENFDNDSIENYGNRLYSEFKQLIKKATEI